MKLIVLLLTFVFLLPYPTLAVTKDTVVSATIGQFTFTLYGYTSPNALVTFEGVGIKDQTFADSTGFFQFRNRFSPFSPREACLTAQDQLGRNSNPLCLPPFPTNYNVNIGPVILPPTVSLNKSTYYVKDTVVVTGQTVPKTAVNLSLYQGKNLLLKTVSPSSFKFPEVQATSDVHGNFSVVLPSSKSTSYRLFTQTTYKKEVSPKSLTLSLSIFPIWMIIIQFLLFLWQLFLSRVLEVIMLIQAVILAAWLYRHYAHPHRIRSLMIREKHELMKLT
jgi:hypothetical protein